MDQLIGLMAILWESWTNLEGEEVKSYTIITTDPNSFMAGILDRIPMILSIEDEKKWFDKNQTAEDLKAMLQPFPVERMRAYPERIRAKRTLLFGWIFCN